ncbi:MAG: zinc ribbon domain-containing protein [Acidobacteriota bacterium]|nr:zinc ribbon domain-containing protein [Acidobacteriota bacterium]
MFCPQCGSNQSDELKFCKSCGANLYAVRQAVAAREAEEKFDWSKTWVAEMFLSGEEQLRRKQELERLQGITPEVKRYNEIKAGVITACVGIAVTVFLYVISEGIILSGQVPPHDAEIVRRLWVAGVIPFMVGIGLIINGLFVSKRLVEAAKRERRAGPELEAGAPRQGLRSADTSEFIPADFSVTEGTTKHLSSPGPKPSGRDA